jgi:hypothetical protein
MLKGGSRDGASLCEGPLRRPLFYGGPGMVPLPGLLRIKKSISGFSSRPEAHQD